MRFILLNLKLHIIWMAANIYVKQPCDLIPLGGAGRTLDMGHPKVCSTIWRAMNNSENKNNISQVYRHIYIYICKYNNISTCIFCCAYFVDLRGILSQIGLNKIYLVGGFNPFENKKSLKPPPRYLLAIFGIFFTWLGPAGLFGFGSISPALMTIPGIQLDAKFLQPKRRNTNKIMRNNRNFYSINSLTHLFKSAF